MSDLTAIVLTKNEELNIEACVLNAKQVTDDVLVIDSGSTDRTVELAEKCGARVVFRAWDNDFSAQRNFALTQTKAEWVLYLDADERMNEELVESVKQAVENDKPHMYSIKRKTVAFGKKFNHGVLEPDYVGRMFKRCNVCWINKVHERPECKDKKTILEGDAEKCTDVKQSQKLQKINRFSHIWAENAYLKGKKTNYASAFLHALLAFLKMYVFKLGAFDGWPGLVMCCNHSFYTLYKYVKLIEMQDVRK